MKKALISDADEIVSFRDRIAHEQRNAVDRRKGERTRDRIRLVTVELLNEIGYRDLTVSTICKRANVTPPVLYLYFESKEKLVHDVLLEFLQDFTGRMGAKGGARTAYEAMFDANLNWIRSARANAGLMRCLLQFSEEQQEFAQLFARESDRWHWRITQSIIRRFPQADRESDEVHLVVHALGGMMDEITRRLFTQNEPQLAHLVDKIAPSDEALAHLLTGIWHRALYCADPPRAEAKPLTPLLVAAAAKAGAKPKPRRKTATAKS